MFNWGKFKGNGNIVVHCKTEEECKTFCNMMKEHGMCWSSCCSYDNYKGRNEYFSRYIENGIMCYSGSGEGSRIAFYKSVGAIIYTYQDVIASEDINGYVELDYQSKVERKEQSDTYKSKYSFTEFADFINSLAAKKVLYTHDEVEKIKKQAVEDFIKKVNENA